MINAVSVFVQMLVVITLSSQLCILTIISTALTDPLVVGNVIYLVHTLSTPWEVYIWINECPHRYRLGQSILSNVRISKQ
jgi:hypothetical protein